MPGKSGVVSRFFDVIFDKAALGLVLCPDEPPCSANDEAVDVLYDFTRLGPPKIIETGWTH